MRNYFVQTAAVSAELAEMRSRLQLVECDCRENLEAVNDLSEDMRKDIDAIYEAIGALSVKLPKIQNPAQKNRIQKVKVWILRLYSKIHKIRGRRVMLNCTV